MINESKKPLVSNSRLPLLKVAHPSTNEVKTRKAQISDFILGGEGIGDELTVTVVGYTYTVMYFGLKGFAKITFSAENDDYQQSDKYLTFKNEYKTEANKVSDGLELLLWLPERKTYASFFCKGTLADEGVKMVNMASGVPNKSLVIKTIPMETKSGNFFHLLDIKTVDLLDYPKGAEIVYQQLLDSGTVSAPAIEDKSADKLKERQR